MKSVLLLLALVAASAFAREEAPTARATLERLALADESEHPALLEALSESGDPFIGVFVDAWRTGDVYAYRLSDAETIILHRVSGKYLRVATGEQISLTSDDESSKLEKNRPSRKLRRDLKSVTDTIDLSSPNVGTRIDAALKLGQTQDPEYLEALRKRLTKETHERVQAALREGIAISLLANASGPEERSAAIVDLGDLYSLAARDQIFSIGEQAKLDGDTALAAICKTALRSIDGRQTAIETWGNLVRGLSLGSVLLIVAFGLAITFGLMGIINMAHGEFVAIGGYTCYVMQNLFADSFGTQSAAYQWFFWASLPVCFLVAGGLGYALEKGLFRFLYKRPLESLLATWGLSMVMQQVFRLYFGAANVQVNTPDALIGNFEFAGVALSYSRIFVIAFAGFVVLLTWFLLSKTNLGLYIRAVMQNRTMASNLGIPVSRVNSLTFAFGCGLAALAGAALSQIGNVGPTMGQTYIVDSFMVVVVGGVGNLLGAGLSALGIGVTDQFLQPSLGPVMGKIIVFFVIILFLQWKPGGLFPTKSRSMED